LRTTLGPSGNQLRAPGTKPAVIGLTTGGGAAAALRRLNSSSTFRHESGATAASMPPVFRCRLLIAILVTAGDSAAPRAVIGV